VKVGKGDTYARTQEIFTKSTKLKNLGQQRTYSITNLPPPVRNPSIVSIVTTRLFMQ
jgi:hypothetical protein